MIIKAAPIGGSMWNPRTVLVGLLALLGLALIAWRFAVGLGPSTGLSDGYPWGLWIAFDVVTGTALACGGYAMALLVYIFNQGRYHSLVRPAILTSALGYSMAAIGIIVDVGRPWLMWRIPLSPSKWNLDSALLEVALCVMAYVIVVWIELAPAILDRWARSDGHPLQGFARIVGRNLERILLWVVALGILLPTMHQSSLGTVILLAGPRLHPLYNTAWVPLLFLLSCMAMGWAMVVFESTVSARAFSAQSEHRMLRHLSLPIGLMVLGFLVLRFADVFVSGKQLLLGEQSLSAWMFWAETALFGIAALMLLVRRKALGAGRLFRSAVLVAFAGAMYRFDIYLVAFQPGEHWSYFPTVPELFISVGLVAIEVFLYIYIVRRLPILGLVKRGEGTPPKGVSHA